MRMAWSPRTPRQRRAEPSGGAAGDAWSDGLAVEERKGRWRLSDELEPTLAPWASAATSLRRWTAKSGLASSPPRPPITRSTILPVPTRSYRRTDRSARPVRRAGRARVSDRRRHRWACPLCRDRASVGLSMVAKGRSCGITPTPVRCATSTGPSPRSPPPTAAGTAKIFISVMTRPRASGSCKHTCVAWKRSGDPLARLSGSPTARGRLRPIMSNARSNTKAGELLASRSRSNPSRQWHSSRCRHMTGSLGSTRTRVRPMRTAPAAVLDRKSPMQCDAASSGWWSRSSPKSRTGSNSSAPRAAAGRRTALA